MQQGETNLTAIHVLTLYWEPKHDITKCKCYNGFRLERREMNYNYVNYCYFALKVKK